MPARSRTQLFALASCLLSWSSAAAAAAGGSKGKQSSSSSTKASGQLSPNVTAVILPTHGSSLEEAATAISKAARTLTGFASSLIITTPTTPDGSSISQPSKQQDTADIPALLQHSIAWTGDASAALNAAAGVAHAAGAAWLFVAWSGDTVTVRDAALVLQQLQASCPSEQLLMCHTSLQGPEAQACLFKLPLQGHFEGPTQPTYIPNSSSSNNSSRNSSSSNTRSSSSDKQRGIYREQAIQGCPPGIEPDRLTLSGILYQPAVPGFAQLRSQVGLLRKHLSTNPPHAAWWQLQLAAAFRALGKLQQAEQHLDAAYVAAASRRLAAAAMYKLAELRLLVADFQGAVVAATRGIARHVTPDLLWIAALASYQAADYRGAISWGEMAARVACREGACTVDRPAAFVDVETWYEKPYDVLRWAYQLWGGPAAAEVAQRYWEAAAVLRTRQVSGNSSSRFIVLGLQALPLLQLQDDQQDALEPPPAPTEPRIASSITTAHRPELFRRTWHSFRARCLDCTTLIDRWYAVDDGSSPEALAQMQQAAPPCTVTWLDKGPGQEGHVGSLNRILQEVHAQGFDYLLHLEDDWYFLTDDEFISKALRIMHHDPTVAQVLLNQDYADTDAPLERQEVASGEARITADGLPYVQHVYPGPQGSPEHAAYVAEHAKGRLNNFHWPGFSLRPGVWRLAAFQQVGEFVPGLQFEEAFGHRLHDAGYRVAFLGGVSCVHLAPVAPWLQQRQADLNEVYARHGLRLQHTPNHQHSAYDINVAWR